MYLGFKLEDLVSILMHELKFTGTIWIIFPRVDVLPFQMLESTILGLAEHGLLFLAFIFFSPLQKKFAHV